MKEERPPQLQPPTKDSPGEVDGACLGREIEIGRVERIRQEHFTRAEAIGDRDGSAAVRHRAIAQLTIVVPPPTKDPPRLDDGARVLVPSHDLLHLRNVHGLTPGATEHGRHPARSAVLGVRLKVDAT